jgi:hypothetical protein
LAPSFDQKKIWVWKNIFFVQCIAKMQKKWYIRG